MSWLFINGVPTKSGASQSWSSYWSSLNPNLDYWANGIKADGLSLDNQVGTGGTLKQFPCWSFVNTDPHDRAAGSGDTFLALDATATYEYRLVTWFETLEDGAYRQIMSTRADSGGGGWVLARETNDGFYLSVYDSTNTNFAINELANHYFIAGLNTISIKFNLPTKEITVTINGTAKTATHNLGTVLDETGHTFTLGTGHWSVTQKAISFKLLKNDVVIKDFVLGDLYGADGGALSALDIYGGNPLVVDSGTPSKAFQDLANPYFNGYDLYLIEDTLKYQAVSPINVSGNSANPNTWGDNSQDGEFPLFKRVLATELGYHILNYIEMPDLPIFDTTDRNVWKASIEADPYYVGGTTGQERWFHRTWLDFDWIDTHIETAYKGLLVVQCLWKKATGGDYIKVKILNIGVLKTPVSHFLTRRDTYETESLGSFYQSFNMRSDNGKRYATYAALGQKRVALDGNFLKYSSDGGHTYNDGIDFSSTYAVAKISQIRITKAGNILIFSNNKLVHYSDDNLATVTAASVVNADDSPYVFHTPANANYPGGYFGQLNSFVETDDCLVVGNYANAGTGASPINLYYSIDDGATWKVFYTYGQNPIHTDDGSANGGTGGTLLGDAGNTIITSRVEGINIGYDGNIYVATEGATTGGVLCGSMMKCVYNAGTDAWTVTALLNATYATYPRMRCNGCYEKDGYIYWAAADINTFVVGGITYQSKGIYKCAVADINDVTKHTLVSSPSGVLANNSFSFKNNHLNGHVLCNMSSEVHISKDYGETWEIFDNKVNSNLLPVKCDAEADKFYSYLHYVMEIL